MGDTGIQIITNGNWFLLTILQEMELLCFGMTAGEQMIQQEIFILQTPEDFAQDILAGYNLLCARKEIDKRKIGLIGHSAGGLVASIAASVNPNIGFIVLLAGPGIGGKEGFMLQTDLKLKNR